MVIGEVHSGKQRFVIIKYMESVIVPLDVRETPKIHFYLVLR